MFTFNSCSCELYGAAANITGIILDLLELLRWLEHPRRYLNFAYGLHQSDVCDILEEKPLVSRSEGEGETWVVAPWLRDYLLSPKERKDPFLWRKVEKLVQEDSRIDQYPKLVKGESKVVWEWQ
ncbi:UNVERIFIED_CONTAM: hypothetical protein Sangu_2741300, partial [Sesamum angustifolium]